MALEGTLRDFSFADILQLISLQRKTGVLTLKSGDNVTTVVIFAPLTVLVTRMLRLNPAPFDGGDAVEYAPAVLDHRLTVLAGTGQRSGQGLGLDRKVPPGRVCHGPRQGESTGENSLVP